MIKIRSIILLFLVLNAGCTRVVHPEHSVSANELKKELFGLSTSQLSERGITEITDDVPKPMWMLAGFTDRDTNSQAKLVELFKEHNIFWYGSSGLGLWGIYVNKDDFPQAQVLLMECKRKYRLKMRVWHPAETPEEKKDWMSN